MERNPRDIRIVFMGTPEFAARSLEALLEGGYSVVGVVTTPDRPQGRGRRMQPCAVKQLAVSRGIPCLEPERLRDEGFLESLAALRPELGVVVAFRMLPREVWAMPALGTFNLHASLLPAYRGAAPINRAIMNGETVTGDTTFFLNERIDEGGIILQQPTDILPEDDAGTLHDRLMEIGAGLVLRTVDLVASGECPVTAQSMEAGLPTAPKIFREDCMVDFTRRGCDIVNHVRGLSPYPAAWSELGGQSYKIFKASFRPCDDAPVPGTVVSDGRSSLSVACADGLVDILSLQMQGRRRMETAEFLRGFDITPYV